MSVIKKLGVLLLIAASPVGVFATPFITTLDLIPASGVDSIDSIVMNWSTDESLGIVDETELTDWTIELYSGATLVYTDIVISAGLLQPIGGVARSVGDVAFNFGNLGDALLSVGSGLNSFDNDFPVLQTAGLGTTFNVFSAGPFNVCVQKYVEGVFNDGPCPGPEYTQETIPGSVPVPAPTTTALLALSLLGVGFARKRRGH